MENKQRILVSGSSGLIGSALCRQLERDGHEVLRLVRPPHPDATGRIPWDPATGTLDEDDRLEGLDAVMHLAGESIASGRWTHARKARLRNSRVQGTRLLSRILATRKTPPRVLISASAIGYYGHEGDSTMDEQSPTGESFLALICREWEAATEEARKAGIRTLHTRLGLVLAPGGGALGKMERPFRCGLGGIIGSGDQIVSWISLPDLIRAFLFLLDRDDLRGPVNVVSPIPVTNREFTRALGQVWRCPTFMPLPAFAAHLLLGEMAEETLLASCRVHPAVLEKAGFSFEHPDLAAALTWAYPGKAAT